MKKEKMVIKVILYNTPNFDMAMADAIKQAENISESDDWWSGGFLLTVRSLVYEKKYNTREYEYTFELELEQ